MKFRLLYYEIARDTGSKFAVARYLTWTSNFSGRLKQYCLMFSGIRTLLCHRFYCFHSQLCEPFSEMLLDPKVVSLNSHNAIRENTHRVSGCVYLLKSMIRSKIRIVRVFRYEKKRCLKGLFFHSFAQKWPQYQRHQRERITGLLTMLQVCWSFIVFWMVSSRILLYTGQMQDECCNKICTGKTVCGNVVLQHAPAAKRWSSVLVN